jgi:hypothetical protein
MRRGAVATSLIVLVVVLLGVVLAIVTFGTKFGIEMGGQAVVTGNGAQAKPFYTQIGWVRNTAPWPVQITSVDVDSTDVGKPVEVFLATAVSPTAANDGSTPAWAVTPMPFPVTIPANSIRYFGFAVTPASGRVASFGTVTLHFKGPFPVPFSATAVGIQVAVSSPTLPSGLVSTDPSIDPRSVDGYLAVLRSVIKSADTVQIQNVLGSGTTEKQALAFEASQKGFKFSMPVKVTTSPTDPHSKTLQFYTKDPAKDGLTPIHLTWQDFRWSASIG